MENEEDSAWIWGPLPPGTPTPPPALQPTWLELGEGRKLFYLKGGEGQKTILFVHGIGGWAEQWLGVLAAFEGYTWLLPDLPGFGRSSPPAPPTSHQLEAALWQLLEAEGVEEVMLVGNSLGGGLCLRMALEHPRRVTALVIATAAGIRRDLSPLFRLALLPRLGELMLTNQPRVLRARWRAQQGRWRAMPEPFIEEIVQFSRRHDCTPTYLGLLRAEMNAFGSVSVIGHLLPQLRQPVLLCWGDKDPVIPFQHGAYAASHLPHVHFEVFSGCGHYPHWEQWERFQRVVRRFLTPGENPGGSWQSP